MNDNLWIKEAFVNATKGYQYGSSENPIETPYTTAGELYRSLQAEYGRCTGAVYVDTKEGTRKIGWVFQSRQQYDDARKKTDTYIREVWITVLVPTGHKSFKYAEF